MPIAHPSRPKDLALRCNTFRNAVRQTPLVIMLWSPNPAAGPWAGLPKRLLDELERQGHTVFYDEQLGISTTLRMKRGVEYHATEAVDLIVVVQPAYAPIGEARDFEDMRVVDSKMLLFIDEAAPDRRGYDRALALMKSHFNNSETFRNPQDIAQGVLLEKIVAKIGLLQLVKYRALLQAKTWGIALAASHFAPRQPNTVPPFPHNLLELYRAHQDEIDALHNPDALWILACIDQSGQISKRNLWRALALAEPRMQTALALLQQSAMIAETNGIVAATERGKEILHDAGLGAAQRATPTRRGATAARLHRAATVAAIAGFVLTAFVLAGLIAFYLFNTVESQLPLAYTPTRPAPTLTRVATPLPPLTLTPAKR